MKLNKYLFLSAALGAFAFAGCSDDEICEPLSFSFEVSGLGSTATTISSGDVGLWVSSAALTDLAQADVAANVNFQVTGNTLDAAGANWRGQEKLYTYAYYPYDAKASSNPGAYAVTVAADQSNGLATASTGDLLWAKAETTFAGQNVSPKLTFAHVMSKVIVNVKAVDDVTGATAQLSGLKTDAKVNLLSGAVTADGTASAVSLLPVTAASGYQASFEAIVVPQTVQAGADLFAILFGGKVTAKGALASDLTLSSGNQVTLEVTLAQGECTVTVQDIAVWAAGDTVLGEAEARSYQLYDFYDVNGVQGIVISLDKGSDGKHGWITSTDEVEVEWIKGTPTIPTGMAQIEGYYVMWSTSDEAANLAACLLIDPSLESFPAVKWCDDKNATRVKVADIAQSAWSYKVDHRWVLPAQNRLNTMFMQEFFSCGYDEGRELFNAAIEAAPVPADKKSKLESIDWSDYESGIFYFSSSFKTLKNGEYYVSAVGATAADNMADPYNYGVFRTTLLSNNKAKTRAFYHF